MKKAVLTISIEQEKLSADEAEIIEDYIVKTNLIADHDCAFLKDCVKLLKGLGAL